MKNNIMLNPGPRQYLGRRSLQRSRYYIRDYFAAVAAYADDIDHSPILHAHHAHISRLTI
jgi:hypothetical protein